MARLLVVGATRGIGLETVRQALEAGHHVRAMARDTSGLGVEHAELEPFAGDATDPASVAAAVAGIDAVASTLGIRVTASTPFQPTILFSRSTEVLIEAMKDAGVRRLLAVTAIGCGDSIGALSTLEVVARDLALGPVFRDKNLQETLIRNSGLDWTLVRPTFLTRGARTGRYRAMVEPGSRRNGLISRADVAHFIVSQIGSDAYVGKGPVLAY